MLTLLAVLSSSTSFGMEFFWNAINIIVLGLGGTILAYIMKVSHQISQYQAEFSTWREALINRIRELERRLTTMEKWMMDREVPMELESRDIQAIKSALKSHDDRLGALEGLLTKVASRVGVGVDPEIKNRLGGK